MSQHEEIVRIVKLHFKEEHLDGFLANFDRIKERVAGAPGCLSLRLVQHKSSPEVVFTISAWRDESFLNDYRNSAFFADTWKTIKPWFAEKAQAWTTLTYYDQNQTFIL